MSAAAEGLEEALKLLEQLDRYKSTHRLNDYQPYDFQRRFHHAKGFATDKLARQRALLAANQIGKSHCGAMEVAMHLTGRYPAWWKGHKFGRPIVALCGSNTNEQTRDVVQAELFGDPSDDKKIGTGTIPLECITEKPIRKPGVPNAYDQVAVKHITGGTSKVMFRAYEQGAKKHMGSRIDLGWCDEEPPQEIWSQYLRGTFSTNGILMMTFTPEEGVTEVVHQFMHNLSPGQALVRAGWDDAPHMTQERREAFLRQIPAHERDMRSKGIPLMGSGLVFPVKDEEIEVEPFEIPNYWPRLVGIDFGWEHPTAVVWTAWDRDNDRFYVYNEFRETMARIPIVSSTITRHPDSWAPVAWPHDGMHKDKASGKPLAELYREHGVPMLPKPFSNPPSPGQEDGTGGQGVEVGVLAMLEAMEEGRFKVFKTCPQWFEERRIYHRKDGQIVKLHDDLMSATRYAFQSKRYADVKPRGERVVPIRAGMRNW